jgi:hypothetical protein
MNPVDIILPVASSGDNTDREPGSYKRPETMAFLLGYSQDRQQDEKSQQTLQRTVRRHD